MNSIKGNMRPALSARNEVPIAISYEAGEGIMHNEPSKPHWAAYLWDTFDKSPEERRFLFKIDAAILTVASLGYFIKNLDQININNANLLLTRIRPSLWIPSCEVTWSVLTIIMAKCSSAQQIYVLRFFIGLAESTFYPGMHYIIGSWYQKCELGKRSCIFHGSSAVGSMFSAYLMAAVYHLDGVHGFKGWQWLFIINTVISLPIAISGFIFLPDMPETTRAWYLTPSDIEIAQNRMRADGRENRAPYTRAKVKKIFSSWHIYLLTLLYILYINGGGVSAQPAFAIWLKQQGYSIPQINAYPTLTTAVQLATTLIYAWISDTILQGERWPLVIFSGIMIIIVNTSLAIWNIPTAWKWACFILAGCSSGIGGLLYAWMHEICTQDNEERALVAASMNELAFVVQAWLPLLIWPQVEAPEYPKGYLASIGISLAMMATAMAIRHLKHTEVASRRLRLPE
ncbi:hypothetical protein NLG97_g1935 [Lecanicillium saksenae]|uniref:Uncharacterized protein n=1 Tax=Lecanicillium saksenae TaxID=468837 RepID=A0ACC1R2J3_9HYPO|nr:hypothetical protein NLG97_g1935 [Lecanicillium saksenae]